jgi:hypothetical protein
MKRWLLIFFSVLEIITETALAENTGKISGRVKDKKSQEPLVGVNVVVEGTTLGARTDLYGDYFILNLSPGLYRVTASYLGYGRLTQIEVQVKIDQTTNLNFDLTEESIQAEAVTVVAQKPKVELDLTASKETMSRDEISRTWGKTLKDVISDVSGTNINGGIRGSFGGDVAYRMDGIDLRDAGSNTNFSSVNMSTIQEVEVLKGGWNAEYGQANGSIVNIVTRKATDQLHAIATYKERPAGQYHWGRNIYDQNDVFHTVMASREYWDTTKTWRTQWMDPNQSQKGNPVPLAFAKAFGKVADTAQAMANWWKQFVNDNARFPQFDYTARKEWEEEITVYGPLTQDIDFLASGRYKEAVPAYPSALKYNPDMTFQGSLGWRVGSGLRIDASGMLTKFDNSGDPRTNYQSTETNVNDIASQALPYISDPYDKLKYWMYGPSNNGSSAGNAGNTTIRSPEHAQMLNVQTKLKQIFSERTYFEMALQYSEVKYRLDFRDIAQTANFRSYGLPLPTDSASAYGYMLPSFGQPPTSNVFGSERWAFPGDVWRSESNTRNFSIKGDLTSQIVKNHLVKGGFIFSMFNMTSFTHEGNNLASSTPYIQVNDIVPTENKPYEGALYVQDKIEVGGMVLNAGVRADFFNANKNVSSNFFDPLMISQYTDGNSGQTGLVGYRQDGSGSAYKKTPTRIALSPRIGISHPITETTVLHFMFGVFNQRPAWVKILANPVVWTDNRASGNLGSVIKAGLLNSDFSVPDSVLVTYRYYGAKTGNPALTFEKMTQFEVGLEQNIADVLSLNMTMYYKEGTNMTSLGINQGPGMSLVTSSGAGVETRLYGEPTTFTNSDNRAPGQYIGNFTTTVNGAWGNVRGIEGTLKSRLQWINFELGYTLSYLTTGRYYDNKIYTTSVLTGKQIADNTFSGPNNSDGGGVGIDDAVWNPHNSAMLKVSVVSPPDFGPTFGSFYPLGDWVLNTSSRWVQGQEFTWYPTDYVGARYPNNQRWFDRWNTNITFSKIVPIADNLKLKFFVQVTNLFNNKHFRLFTGTDLDRYMTTGSYPYQAVTFEPTEWNWFTNDPRQIYFGTTIEF